MASRNEKLDQARGRQVMSLDFIAPAHEWLEHQKLPSFLQSPQSVTEQYDAFGSAASGSASTGNRSATGESGPEESLESSPVSITFDCRPTGRTPTMSVYTDTARQQALATKRRDDDRYNYDDEEKYAILYFRIERAEKWSDVLRKIEELFPPGRPRRRTGKALTELYVERRKGGLECRYYRLREDHGFKPLRSPDHDVQDDRVQLAYVLSTFDLEESFLTRLKQL